MYVAEITTLGDQEAKALWGDPAWTENQAYIKLHEIMFAQRQSPAVTKCVCAILDGNMAQYYVEIYTKPVEYAEPEASEEAPTE